MGRPRADDDLAFDSFWALLSWFDASPERAGEEYERMRRRLALQLAWQGCNQADEVAEEALRRVAVKLAKGFELRRESAGTYFLAVARRVWLEERRRAQKVNFETLSGLEIEARQDSEPSPRRVYMERCLAELPEASRQLLARYYASAMRCESRKALSRELRASQNALRIRVHRLTKKLQACLKRHLAADARAQKGRLD